MRFTLFNTSYGPGVHRTTRQAYRLLYGADLDAKPRYDIEPIRELQRQGQAMETANLGPEIAAPTVEKSSTSPR